MKVRGPSGMPGAMPAIGSPMTRPFAPSVIFPLSAMSASVAIKRTNGVRAPSDRVEPALMSCRGSDDIDRSRDSTPVLRIGVFAKNVEEPRCKILLVVVSERRCDRRRLLPHLAIGHDRRFRQWCCCHGSERQGLVQTCDRPDMAAAWPTRRHSCPSANARDHPVEGS